MIKFRSTNLFRTFAAILILNLCLPFFGTSLVFAKSVTVTSGTPVVLQFGETVSSKYNNVGNKVSVTVSHDVMIDDDIIVKAGTPAIATVTRSKKAGAVGANGAIEVEVTGVHSVDGKLLHISGCRISEEGKGKQIESIVITLLCCILALLIKGEEGEISAGTQITGYTISNVIVEIGS